MLNLWRRLQKSIPAAEIKILMCMVALLENDRAIAPPIWLPLIELINLITLVLVNLRPVARRVVRL